MWYTKNYKIDDKSCPDFVDYSITLNFDFFDGNSKEIVLLDADIFNNKIDWQIFKLILLFSFTITAVMQVFKR